MERVTGVAAGAYVLARSRIGHLQGPLGYARLVRTVRRWGTGPAGGFASLAVRFPDQVGIVDEREQLTWGEIHRRANALARGFASHGVGAGDSVAVLCRNHAGFVLATIAAARLGADLLYLNTSFAAPQLREVVAREKPSLLVLDEEFVDLAGGTDLPPCVVAWTGGTDGARASAAATLDELVAEHGDTDLSPPRRHSRIVILTSGTTGTPKGAPRKEAGLSAAVSLLSRMPIRRGETTHVAAPLFHTWGFAHMMLAMLLGTPMVLRRRFDPAESLRLLREHRCEVFVVIPVMLHRILELDEETLAGARLDSLRIVAASGSALPGTLATAWMDRFGDNLHNIYGSTEIAYASVATPQDLRASPHSAGRPPHGTVVRILDEQGSEVPPGRTGRIFVGNVLLFEGYTGGGSKETVDGLMASGDLGHFDEQGRLHVEGRDDDMIVSGGENVFPQEVEDCIAGHPEVVEVAAVGVDDPDFGQRLRAFVVRRGEVDEAELQELVRTALARYKVPREIVFVQELPRNATGKILRRELAHW